MALDQALGTADIQPSKQPERPTERDSVIPAAATKLAAGKTVRTRKERRAKSTGPRAGIGGRPSTYRPELAEELCNRIATGHALTTILEAKDTKAGKSIYELFPHLKGKLTFCVVMQWLETHAEFATMYARAFQQRADYFADEIVQIADEAKASSNAAVQKAKLRVEARKWTAAKLRPDRYGDRLDINQNVNLQQLDDKALDDRISRLLGLNGAVIEHQAAETEGE